jgi:ABC-2 type transport system permease protein
LKKIIALTWKDLKIFFKDRGGVILIFVQPFMFILIITYALSDVFSAGDHPVHILAVNQDTGTQAAALLDQLEDMKAFSVETSWEGNDLTIQKVERLIIEGKRTFAVIFPPNFSIVLEQGLGTRERLTTKVLLIVDPNTTNQIAEPVLGTIQGLLERAAYTAMMPKGLEGLFTHLGDSTSTTKSGNLTTGLEEKGERGRVEKQEPTVTVERIAPTGMRGKKLPDVYQQNVPGYTIYGIFWIVNLLAVSVLREKREGTFRRLLVAPMSRTIMLIGKWMPYYLINIIQIAIMLGVSSLLFKMSLGHSVGGLIIVSLAAAAAATGLGVLVATLAHTEAQISGLTVLLLLTLSVLGGCFIPRFIMPEWLRTVGQITPHAWALDAYQDLLVRGYNFWEVLPKVGVLGAFAVIFFGIGVWRFRFE